MKFDEKVESIMEIVAPLAVGAAIKGAHHLYKSIRPLDYAAKDPEKAKQMFYDFLDKIQVSLIGPDGIAFLHSKGEKKALAAVFKAMKGNNAVMKPPQRFLELGYNSVRYEEVFGQIIKFIEQRPDLAKQVYDDFMKANPNFVHKLETDSKNLDKERSEFQSTTGRTFTNKSIDRYDRVQNR